MSWAVAEAAKVFVGNRDFVSATGCRSPNHKSHVGGRGTTSAVKGTGIAATLVIGREEKSLDSRVETVSAAVCMGLRSSAVTLGVRDSRRARSHTSGPRYLVDARTAALRVGSLESGSTCRLLVALRLSLVVRAYPMGLEVAAASYISAPGSRQALSAHVCHASISQN